MEFSHRPADGLGERLGHLFQTFHIGHIDAAKFDCNRGRSNRAQLAHRSSNRHFWRALESSCEFRLRQLGQLPAQVN